MNRITIYPEHVKNRISPFLLGHFAEQFRGNIPGGIYMPEIPCPIRTGCGLMLLKR